ncbi:MAG: alpha-hydroxy-acid oxidizing protein [Hyphomicrobiaceae bacterium]|nr:alpha-hydroxy-acid oxidizing protein [Hyphomicrobiaceae bacterium]
MPTLEQIHRYPSVADLRRRARGRIPFFAWEYLDSGTGGDHGMARNEAAFQQITLTPRLMRGEFTPELETELFGRRYAAPFGVSPVGLTGLMWPGAEQILAATAARYRIPYGLSTVATQAPETIGAIAGDMGWFQLYPPRDPGIRRDLLARAKAAGFTTLLVTADVPTGSTRERQRRAGVTVPPKMTALMLWRCAIRPEWTAATIAAGGRPRFRGLEKYVSATDLQNMSAFIGQGLGGTLDWNYLEEVRREWDGPIVVKGILSVADARDALAFGVEGIGVSNHGARQCDGTPAAIDALPRIAEIAAGRSKIVFDSGVRTGLDICRALALGADFVLLGRAFMYGVAALGAAGGDHVAQLLMNDLANNMSQLGCTRVEDLPGRLHDDDSVAGNSPRGVTPAVKVVDVA